jgi:hypothetical protein
LINETKSPKRASENSATFEMCRLSNAGPGVHAEFEDLSSALDFLSSTADRPETHARALRQINRLLERFAG